jgi:hypothetical protein
MARRLVDQDPRREQRRQSLILDRLEVRFRAQIRRALDAASADIIARWELTQDVTPDPDLQSRIAAIYASMAEAAVLTFGFRIIEQGKALGIPLETKGFAETLRRLASEYVRLEAVRQRITAVTETTRALIVAAVERGRAEGLGIAAIARRVRAEVASLSAYRAALIARTETHGAANYGADGAARETGLKLRKEWIAAEDERTRIEHAEADGTVVDQDEPFIVGGEALMYPGDPAGSPENTINCRCALGHIVLDD